MPLDQAAMRDCLPAHAEVLCPCMGRPPMWPSQPRWRGLVAAQAACVCRSRDQGRGRPWQVHGAPVAQWAVGSCCRVEMLDHWAIWARAPRAAPGIEPGTSRTLSENHATRPSSHVAMLESMNNSAPPALVGHLRGLHNQKAGVRWRCKLPASAAVKLRDGGMPWQSMVPRCPVGRGRLLQVGKLDCWCSRAPGVHRAAPGIEPGTSRTLSENRASRPTNL